MQTYNLENANGYIVFNIDGRGILVDIGSPITFAEPGFSADICGVTCEASTGLMAMMAQASGMAPNMGRLSQETGSNISMVLGNDCLSQLKILTDVPGGKITFSTQDIACNGNTVQLRNMMNYLLVKAIIAGDERCVFIDTGAPISYIDGAYITADCRDGMDRVDHSPIYGNITSHTKFVPVTIGGVNVELECVPMSGNLESQISMVNAEGVIGGAIFAEHKVYIDISNNTMKIE